MCAIRFDFVVEIIYTIQSTKCQTLTKILFEMCWLNFREVFTEEKNYKF